MEFSSKSLEEALDRLLYGGLEPGDQRRLRRLQLLEAASALFIRHGYRKTSMAEIARRAGVTKPTVYAHYTSKAHLLLHAIVLEKRGYLDRVAPVFDTSLNPRDRLRELLKQSLILAHEMPLTSRLLRGERDILYALQEHEDVRALAGGSDARADALRTGLYEELIEAIIPGLSLERRRQRAKVLAALGFCSSVLADEELRQGLSIDQFASLLATMLVAGVEHSDERS